MKNKAERFKVNMSKEELDKLFGLDEYDRIKKRDPFYTNFADDPKNLLDKDYKDLSIYNENTHLTLRIINREIDVTKYDWQYTNMISIYDLMPNDQGHIDKSNLLYIHDIFLPWLIPMFVSEARDFRPRSKEEMLLYHPGENERSLLHSWNLHWFLYDPCNEAFVVDNIENVVDRVKYKYHCTPHYLYQKIDPKPYEILYRDKIRKD